MAELVATVLWSVGSAAATDAAIFLASNAVAINAAASFVASAANSSHQRRKAQRAARDAYNASLQDRLVMTPMLNGARSRCYGRVRNVDGIKFKATHGTNSEFYTLVISVAGHEIDGFEQVYFGDTPVTLDVDGYVQDAPWNVGKPTSESATMTVTAGAGSVTLPYTPIAGSVSVSLAGNLGDSGSDQVAMPSVSGAVVSVSGLPVDGIWRVQYQRLATESKARVRMYTGGPSQNLYSVLSALVGSAVQSTDVFAWDSLLVVTLQYDQDAFAGGIPQISARFRGARVYDPRSSTTAWSQNPALLARDWALHAYGGGCSGAEVLDTAVNAAANACDVSTAFVTPAGTETRPLYTGGIVIPLDGNPDQAMDEIVEAMAGKWGWAGGKLTLRAGVYRAPVATIDENWITDAEQIQIVGQTPTADLVNVMRPRFADHALEYVENADLAIPPEGSAQRTAYLAADGTELPLEVTLGAVTDSVHAQHVCGVIMREQREGLTMTLPCNWRAYPLELFDVVQVNLARFGFSGLLAEVVGWQFTLTGGIQLTLRKITAAIYQPDTAFDLITTVDNTSLPDPFTVEQLSLTGIDSSASALADGSVITRTEVAWGAAVDEAIRQSGSIEVQYARATLSVPSGDWGALPFERGTTTKAVAYGLLLGGAYLFRARAINTLGVRGKWSVQLGHVVQGRRYTKTFRQAVGTAGIFIDGDDLFDVTDGNRHYVRATGAWLAVPAGTSALATNAATDVVSTALSSDVWTITGTPPRRSLLGTNYTNSTGAAIVVEVTAYLARKITAAVGSTNLGVYDWLAWGFNGGSVTYGAQGFVSVDGVVAGASKEYPTVVTTAITVAAGDTLNVYALADVTGVIGSGSTLETKNANLRVVAIKR